MVTASLSGPGGTFLMEVPDTGWAGAKATVTIADKCVAFAAPRSNPTHERVAAAERIFHISSAG